jgi:hypothetical protein
MWGDREVGRGLDVMVGRENGWEWTRWLGVPRSESPFHPFPCPSSPSSILLAIHLVVAIRSSFQVPLLNKPTTNLLSLGSLGQLLLPRLLGRPPLLQQGLGDGDLLGGRGGGGDGHSCWMISLFLVVVVVVGVVSR